MKEIRQRTITLTLPSDVELLEKVDQLDRVAVSRIVKAPTGLSNACRQAADLLEKAQGQFMEMKGISPEILRSEGQRIERLNRVIQDLEEVLIPSRLRNDRNMR